MSLLLTVYFTFTCPDNTSIKAYKSGLTPAEALTELAHGRLYPIESEDKSECKLMSVKIGH
jgi:hypothetical protein